MIISIPSKNRLNYTAGKIFLDHTLFVEPQDFKTYSDLFPGTKIVNILENNKGFSYVLNFIVDYTLSQGEKYFLFVDDDIWDVKRKDKNLFQVDEFLNEALELIKKKNYAQLGINFMGHGCFETEELLEDKAVWGMGLMDAEKIKSIGGYDKKLLIFSDYDITAQLIMKGFKVGVWNKYLFLHKMKSQEGGAMTYYKQSELIKTNCEYILKKYGELCKMFFNTKHGIWEVRLNWKEIKDKREKNKLNNILSEFE